MNWYETNRDNDFYGNWQGYNEAVKKYRETPKKVVVCLAGSSFDECIKEIKLLNRDDYYLFCCDIIYFRLVKEHLIPDLVFTLDGFDWWKAGFWGNRTKMSSLVTFTGCNPDNLKNWRGNKYIYRLVCTGQDDIDADNNEAQDWFPVECGFQLESGNIGEVILRFCHDIKADSYWMGLDFGMINGEPYAKEIVEKMASFQKKEIFTYGIYQYKLENQEGGFIGFNQNYKDFAHSFLNIINIWEYEITNLSKGSLFEYINPILTTRINQMSAKEFVNGFVGNS